MEESTNPSLESEIEETHQDNDQQKLKRSDEEQSLLQFLDSTDDYLNLLDAFSATLRQGWLDLASARHSMGASRINTACLDLNTRSAPTSLRVAECDGCQPYFNLRKWTSTDGGQWSGEEECEDKLLRKSDSPQLRQRNISEFSENSMDKSSVKKEGALIIDDQVQKERSRTLSMFGTLVSPKLRSAQISFETALETLVEIANKRIAMSSSFDQVKKDLESSKA